MCQLKPMLLEIIYFKRHTNLLQFIMLYSHKIIF